MNNSRLGLVSLVAAFAAIVLGSMALSTAMSMKKAVSEVMLRLDSEAAGNAQARDELRMTTARFQDALDVINRQMVNIRDQVTTAVARAVATATAKPADTAQVRAPYTGTDTTVAPPPNAKAVYHTITSGDNYGRIARQYGVSVSALERLNPDVSANRLKLGKKIRVK